jgi:hypothetical protein
MARVYRSQSCLFASPFISFTSAKEINPNDRPVAIRNRDQSAKVVKQIDEREDKQLQSSPTLSREPKSRWKAVRRRSESVVAIGCHCASPVLHAIAAAPRMPSNMAAGTRQLKRILVRPNPKRENTEGECKSPSFTSVSVDGKTSPLFLDRQAQ